jgi:phosphatidylglycerol:prolipoprotein diacylglycerol transferase
MLPVLFSIGSVKIYSFGVLLAIGFFGFGFLSWRRLRDLGFDQEKIVDLFFQIVFFGFLFARFLFWLFAGQGLKLIPKEFWLVGKTPGLSFWGFVAGGIAVLKVFSKKQRWDIWKVADELTLAFLPLAILWQAGLFLSGAPLGRPTGAVWGLFFPGDLIRRQPVSLFALLLSLFVLGFLLKIERSWRTWRWYPSGRPGLIDPGRQFRTCFSDRKSLIL